MVDKNLNGAAILWHDKNFINLETNFRAGENLMHAFLHKSLEIEEILSF